MNSLLKHPYIGFFILILILPGLGCTEQTLDEVITTIYDYKGNRPPTINAVILEKSELGFGDEIEITVLAADPDGDSLRYRYAAIDESLTDENGDPYAVGTITGSGATVVYKAPSDRTADVTFTILVEDITSAGDFKGGYDQEIRVLSIRNVAPEINTFLIISDGVFLGEDIPIYFQAGDGDGDTIHYTLSSNKSGTFSPTATGTVAKGGNHITFSNFKTWGDIEFKLELTDNKGNYTFDVLETTISPPLGEEVSFSQFDAMGTELSNSTLVFDSPTNGWFLGIWGILLHYTLDEETGKYTWQFVSNPYSEYDPFQAISITGQQTAWFISMSQVFYYYGTSVAEMNAPKLGPEWDARFTDIYMKSDEEGWLASTNGIFKWDGTKWKLEILESDYYEALPNGNNTSITDLIWLNAETFYAVAKWRDFTGYGSDGGAVFIYDGSVWKDQRGFIWQEGVYPYTNLHLITESRGILFNKQNYFEYNPIEAKGWGLDNIPVDAYDAFIMGAPDFIGSFDFLGSAGFFAGANQMGTDYQPVALRYNYGSDLWENISEDLPDNEIIRDLSIINSDILYVCTSNGRILQYSDETWTEETIEITRSDVSRIVPHKIEMLSPDSGWVIASATRGMGRDPIYIVLHYDGTKWSEFN
jgi:hypothetical protein